MGLQADFVIRRTY